MKRFLAFLGLALLLLGCTQPSGGTGGANNNTQGGNVQTGNVSVSLSNFAFSPATITITSGSTVTWTNLDSAPHTVTADDTSQFSSGTLAQGGTFVHTFDTPGTYTYHCSIHTSMKGTVIVQ